MRTSIQTRLAVAFFGLGTLPLITVGIILVWHSFGVQKAQAINLQGEVADRALGEVSHFFGDVTTRLGFVADGISSSGESDHDRSREILNQQIIREDVFEELALVDDTGWELERASRLEPVSAADLGRRDGADEIISRLSTGEVYYSSVSFDQITGEPLMTMAVPLIDPRTSKLESAVFATIRLKKIWDLIARIRVGDAGSVYMVDESGRVFAHRDRSVVLRGTDFSLPAEDGIHRGLDGSRVVLAVKGTKLGDKWLSVAVERPLAEALALTIRSVITVALILSVALVLAGAAAFLAVRQIVRPLRSLANSATAVAAGDLSPRIELQGGDEVGQLAESFRTMVDRLKSAFASLENTVSELKGRESELKRLNESLEERVRERTRELAQTNQDLEGEVAERRQAEEALQHKAQELARSNAELEQFGYVASHDLKEPLRKVQAFGDLLVRKSGDGLNEQGRGYLERIQNAAARMQILIDDLLSYSRVTTQAQPFVPVDLGQVAQEVVTDLEVRIDQSGGRVEVADLATVDADPTQMRQLLQNLIANALKFNRPEEPPVVKVSGRLLNGHDGGLAGTSDDGHFELTVNDNGIGFEEKYADRIFGIFQRLHGRGTYEGTGIGLATCRKIAERHGGSITAKSKPEEGATFIVALPLKQL